MMCLFRWNKSSAVFIQQHSGLSDLCEAFIAAVSICEGVTFSRMSRFEVQKSSSFKCGHKTRPVFIKRPDSNSLKYTNKSTCFYHKGPHMASSPRDINHKMSSPFYQFIFYLQICYLPWMETPKRWPSCKRLWIFYWPTSWNLSTGKRKLLIFITRTSCCSLTTGSCRTSRRPWTISWSAAGRLSNTPSRQVGLGVNAAEISDLTKPDNFLRLFFFRPTSRQDLFLKWRSLNHYRKSK